MQFWLKFLQNQYVQQTSPINEMSVIYICLTYLFLVVKVGSLLLTVFCD